MTIRGAGSIFEKKAGVKPNNEALTPAIPGYRGGVPVCCASGLAQSTYTYALLGYDYVETVTPLIQARDGLLYGVGQDETSDGGQVYNSPLASTANANSVYVFGLHGWRLADWGRGPGPGRERHALWNHRTGRQ